MKHAFSLVELSIVLVILGLLTGGILTGQSLIRAAELRSVTTQLSTYRTAFYIFRDKYFAIPGDMTNATDFWGAADGGDGIGSDCFYTISTDQTTCNGDGDGSIDHYTGTTTGGAELYRAWQQLANAGLIEGSYTGAPTTNPIATNQRYAALGVNTPRAKISTGGFTWMQNGNHDGTGWAWAGSHTHILMFGTLQTNDITEDPILKPEEAWNIDTKLDDGKPGTGHVITARTDSDCNSSTTLADQYTATYDLTETSIACYILFNGK